MFLIVITFRIITLAIGVVLQLYNNVDGIAEPHMVHLALFMQKVMTTLSRIEAIKTNQSQRHAKSEAQLTKLQLSPNGNVIIAPVTPPSSPIASRKVSTGGRKTLSRAFITDDEEDAVRDSENESYNPFRTASFDSSEVPNDAATRAIIEQQRRLEEEYLQAKAKEAKQQQRAETNGLPQPPSADSLSVSVPGAPETSPGVEGGDKFSPPSPPPSPNSSPRSPSSAPYTPTGKRALMLAC